MKVVLANTSGEDLDISGGVDGNTGIRSNHIFEIRNDQGETVPQKVHKQTEPMTGNVFFGVLKPGEKSITVEDISRAYAFTRPGKYTIQMSRPIPGSSKDEVVKSNMITVIVAP